MEHSKLMQLFEKLDANEVSRLKLFAASPYFNPDEKIKQFIHLLDVYRDQPNFLSKLNISKLLFDSEIYQDGRMRKLMNQLLGLIEQFLFIEQLQKQPFDYQIKRCQAYRKLGLAKHNNFSLKQLNREHEQNQFRNADFYYEAYQLHYETYLFYKKGSKREIEQLQKLSDAIDISYLSLKLKQACFMTSKKAMFNKDYDAGMLPFVIQYVKNKGLLNIPAIAIYYHAYKAFTEPEEVNHFNNLRQTTLENGHAFPKEEIQDLYLLAINYCIRRLNEGDSIYLAKGLNLYKEGLTQKHLITNNEISRTTYSNIVALGLKQQDYEWVYAFIENYKSFLPQKYQESVHAFCLARYNYELKAYDQTIQLLSTIEYPDIVSGLVAKTILLKVYFEKGEFKLLDAHLFAMDIYLRRKQVIGYHKRNYRKILMFTKQLMRINFYDRSKVMKLKTEIEAAEGITEKKWLLAQVEKLGR